VTKLERLERERINIIVETAEYNQALEFQNAERAKIERLVAEFTEKNLALLEKHKEILRRTAAFEKKLERLKADEAKAEND
jgi:predicted transcriptional regulator